MNLRHVVPSLALLAAIPATQAVEVTVNDDAKLSIGLRVQSRIEMAQATDVNGTGADVGDLDIWEKKGYPDAAEDSQQSINLFWRRIRLSLKGSYKDSLNYMITFASDKSAASSNSLAGPSFYEGFVGYTMKSGDIKHDFQFGYTLPPVIAGVEDSTGSLLMATERTTAKIAAWSSRYMNIRYTATAPLFAVATYLGENDAGANGPRDTTDGNPAGFENNHWILGARVSTSLKDEWKLKRTESTCGKNEGFKHELGVGLGLEMYDSISNGPGDAFVVALDYAVHYNALTANFDLAYRSWSDATVDSSGAQADLNSLLVGVQAGWCFCLDSGLGVEPALRLGMIDQSDENDDEYSEYTEEGGQSGTYIQLGCNVYMNGHSNKLHAGLELFSPEEGDGDATIFRVQHQLQF